MSGHHPWPPPKKSDAAPRYDCPMCGHPKALHYGFGVPGPLGCSATVDARPATAGGDTLTPCKCRGYIPLVKEPIR